MCAAVVSRPGPRATPCESGATLQVPRRGPGGTSSRSLWHPVHPRAAYGNLRPRSASDLAPGFHAADLWRSHRRVCRHARSAGLYGRRSAQAGGICPESPHSDVPISLRHKGAKMAGEDHLANQPHVSKAVSFVQGIERENRHSTDGIGVIMRHPTTSSAARGCRGRPIQWPSDRRWRRPVRWRAGQSGRTWQFVA